MSRLSTRALVLLGIVAALVLTGLSLALVALARVSGGEGCASPVRDGTLVKVVATDHGVPGPSRMMPRSPLAGDPMRLSPDRSSVPRGEVTFQLANSGWMPHELMVLPLDSGQSVGSRPVGRDGRADEQGSLGHALAACSEGVGSVIRPAGTGWLTLSLPPGRYELLCNLPGHYAAGMRTELTVR